MVFRRLLRTGHFSSQLCCADVIPILKGAMAFSLSRFIPISITPVLSKVYEVFSRLSAFMEKKGVFPRHQYAYRKGLRTYNASLDIV